MAATHTLPLASPGMARICLYGDLQRFGRRIDLHVKTGAEAIRALAMQIPAFRQKLSDGWYQVRIAGRDTGENELSARLNEPLEKLAPKASTATASTTDNGKQNTYFSSLDNMVAQGNVVPVLYGEMRVGSRVISQEISTADEGDGGQIVVIGR